MGTAEPRSLARAPTPLLRQAIGRAHRHSPGTRVNCLLAKSSPLKRGAAMAATEQAHAPEVGGSTTDEEEPLLGLARRPSVQHIEPVGKSLLGWVALTVGTQTLWGLYPVASRYLETVPSHPLPPFRVITYVNVIACLVLLVTYTGPLYLYRTYRSGPDDTKKGEQNGPVVSVSMGELVGNCVVLGASVSLLAAGMIVGSTFAPAFLILLVFMFAPLFVGPLAYLVLGMPISPLLWPTIGATLVGAGLAVDGGLSAGGDAKLGAREFLGMGIALVGTLGQAVFMVFVQKTAGYVSNDAILYINYASMLSFAPLISLLTEKQAWSDVLHYNALELGNLGYLSIGVYCIGNLLQQVCVRKLGAPVFAVFISVRLLASIVGSWILLDERIANATEASGCIVIVLAVTAYLLAKAYSSMGARKPAPA